MNLNVVDELDVKMKFLFTTTSLTVINHCCRHPVAILSVNSIIDALDKSGSLDCSYFKKVYSLYFYELEQIDKVRYK